MNKPQITTLWIGATLTVACIVYALIEYEPSMNVLAAIFASFTILGFWFFRSQVTQRKDAPQNKRSLSANMQMLIVLLAPILLASVALIYGSLKDKLDSPSTENKQLTDVQIASRLNQISEDQGIPLSEVLKEKR